MCVARLFATCIFVSLLISTAAAVERFDTDPGWDHENNRPPDGAGVRRVQDFGYTETSHAGGETGEIGGVISRAFLPAYYGMPIAPKTLGDRLEASGKIAVTDADGGGFLVGWFNQNSRGWRTPNSLVFRVNAENDQFRVFFEYGTQNRKTGGGATFEGIYQNNPDSLRSAGDAVHRWHVIYDPRGANGDGLITFTFDDETFTAALDPGHKADGATFDRFGILNTQVPGGSATAYLDDLTVDGVELRFDQDPRWDALGNRAEYLDTLKRPLHNFGYSETSYAGGEPGEIGGTVWRIESLEPETSAYYGEVIEPLSLKDSLHASGKIAMTAASVDSGVLIGWFNDATFRGAPPLNFLGVFVEGPSRIGHYFRPVYCSSDNVSGAVNDGPVLHADSTPREWSIDYSPEQSTIVVTLEGEQIALQVPPAARKGNATFNRFGMLSWLRGGHFVQIYLDDITFTGAEK